MSKLLLLLMTSSVLAFWNYLFGSFRFFTLAFKHLLLCDHVHLLK